MRFAGGPIFQHRRFTFGRRARAESPKDHSDWLGRQTGLPANWPFLTPSTLSFCSVSLSSQVPTFLSQIGRMKGLFVEFAVFLDILKLNLKVMFKLYAVQKKEDSDGNRRTTPRAESSSGCRTPVPRQRQQQHNRYANKHMASKVDKRLTDHLGCQARITGALPSTML